MALVCEATIQAALDRIRQGCTIHQQMGQPLHEPEQLQILYDVLRPAHHSFQFYIQSFGVKHNRTFDRAVKFMEEGWIQIQNAEPDAGTQGSARSTENAYAAEGPMVTLSSAALQQMIATAVATAMKTTSSTAQATVQHAAATPKKYCWTHGLGGHDGDDCTSRRDGHLTGPHITFAAVKTHGGSDYVRGPRQARGAKT